MVKVMVLKFTKKFVKKKFDKKFELNFYKTHLEKMHLRRCCKTVKITKNLVFIVTETHKKLDKKMLETQYIYHRPSRKVKTKTGDCKKTLC